MKVHPFVIFLFLAAFVFLGAQWMNNRSDAANLRDYGAQADARVAHRDSVIGVLQCRMDSIDSANVEIARLYLVLADSIATNATDLETFAAALPYVDRSGLHRITDSLVAGYIVNRERYRTLLRSRTPGIP